MLAPVTIATFHFERDFDEFLAPARRGAAFTHACDGHPAVKDTLEALGVPHTEIEALAVNGRGVDFGYALHDGDAVAVYAAASPGIACLRPPVPDERRFVLDTHLGKLANYLRLLGFDTLYRNDYADDELARISESDGRILLTRDVGLLKRGAVVYGHFLRATHPRTQLVEIARRYALAPRAAPLRRCARCNGVLAPLDADTARARVGAARAAPFAEFRACPDCGQVYWKGSHYERLQQFIAGVLAEVTT
jgi:uncharacterized protein with PIN domain